MSNKKKKDPPLALIMLFLLVFCLVSTLSISNQAEKASNIIEERSMERNIVDISTEVEIPLYSLVTVQQPIAEEQGAAEECIVEDGAGRNDQYAEIEYTDEDVELLAKLVYLEARGESFEGQQAVAEVVLNRVLDQEDFWYVDTISEVIFDNKYALQFSVSPYIETAEPDETQYEAVNAALNGDGPVTELDVLYFSTTPRNEKIYMVIGNHYFCRV